MLQIKFLFQIQEMRKKYTTNMIDKNNQNNMPPKKLIHRKK